MHNASTGVTMEFKYNHEGLRTRKVKKVNGTVTETTDYILKGKHIVAMKKNTDTYYFTYDASGKPATVNFNGANYTYVKNLQGDIVGILDASGNLVVEYKYDAWGAPTYIYSASTACEDLAFDNPFRYRGYVWDEEMGLYYLRSRYYNPENERFINIDSLISDYCDLLSSNVHAYCKNNSINGYDPTGYKMFMWYKPSLRDFQLAFENTMYAMWDLFVATANSVSVEVGIGEGIGGGASVVIQGIEFSAEAVAAITDSVYFKGEDVEALITSKAEISVACGGILASSFGYYKQHSYSDEECTCTFFDTSFGEKASCVANEEVIERSTTIGFGVEAYFILGGKIDASFDYGQFLSDCAEVYKKFSNLDYIRGK